jgi:formylglycine-generating enzyme required for sulfatase activity
MKEQFPGFASMSAGLGWMRWHADPQQKLQPLAQIVPDCPAALSDLVERMLEKDASKRIRDLDELESELKDLAFRLQQTDQFATPPIDILKPIEPQATAAKTGRSKPLLIVTMFGLFAAIAFGAWFWTTGRWRTLWPAKMQSASSNSAGTPTTPAAYPQVAETATGRMLLIPKGEFTMGDDSLPIAAPAHKVALAAFYLDRVEVTNSRYHTFCQRAARALPPKPSWDSGYLSKGDYPVINVTWDDARTFCEFSGERLPSEAEWEKAARGIEPFIHWANWTLPGLANLRGTATLHPSAVGSFPADVSPYGVLDMAGNVQEWVNDSYQPYSKTPSGNSFPPEDGRKLVRGGSYAAIPDRLSPAWRGWVAEGSGPAQSPLVGFRCAADPARIITSAR